MNQVYRAKWTVFWLACSRHSVSRVRQSDGGEQVKLHTGKTRGKKMGGEWGESKGMPVNILNKGLFRTVYWIPVYPLIGGLWHLLTLEHWWHWWGMRYGGRETSVSESRGHRSYYKQCNREFPVWGIFFEEQKICLNLVPEASTLSQFF